VGGRIAGGRIPGGRIAGGRIPGGCNWGVIGLWYSETASRCGAHYQRPRPGEEHTMSEEKSFFDRNMEMWERWTSSYMDTMSRAMERTMEQSTSLRKQVDKAVAMAVGTQFDVALAAIKALETQVETLSTKIDELMQQDE
jgi:hypothetical protein